MARTYTISGSLVTVGGDPFDEGRDDFLEFDLQDEAGDAIADASVVSVTATLRSLDTGALINDRDAQDVLGVNGGDITDGTFRLDLTGTGDMVAIGPRALQRRELTLLVTHDTDKVFPLVVRFLFRPFADVGE